MIRIRIYKHFAATRPWKNSIGARTSCRPEREARTPSIRLGEAERAAHAGGQDVRAPLGACIP
jgi:hypothetical protein